MEKKTLPTPETDPISEAESLSPRRHFGVTLLAWLVLSLSAWGLLRLLAALRWWDVLERFNAHLGPPYLFSTGAGWSLVGIVLLWSIFTAKPWAYLAIPISAILWLAEYWVERIFFEGSRSNLPFTAFGSIVLLVVILISIFNRSTRKYLTKSEEHEQPKEH